MQTTDMPDSDPEDEARADDQQQRTEALAERISDRTALTPAVAHTYVLYRRGLSNTEIAAQRDVSPPIISQDLGTIREAYAKARTLAALAADDPEDDPKHQDLWDAGAETISEHTTLTEPQATVWNIRKRHGRFGWTDEAGQALGDLAGDGQAREYTTLNDHVTAINHRIQDAEATVDMIELDGLFDGVQAITDVDDPAEAETSE